MDVTESSTSTSLIVDNMLEETDASEENEQLSPEYLQRKLYFLLEHLKKMHSELNE